MNNSGFSTKSIHPPTSQPTEFDVMTPISVSTTYKQNSSYSYARYTSPTRTTLEDTLDNIFNAETLTFSAGVSAILSLLVYYRPNAIYLTNINCYHGTLLVFDYYKQIHKNVDITAFTQDAKLKENDIIWIETPVNPTGNVIDIRPYVRTARLNRAKVIVDATLAPPPLLNPLKFGVECVVHSATKFLNGHSDATIGLVVCNSKSLKHELLSIRTALGLQPGNLETWLLLRSIKTLKLRVLVQSENATKLAVWLHTTTEISVRRIVKCVHHASINEFEGKSFEGAKAQMPNGWSPVFTIETFRKQDAELLPETCKIFVNATSLGGVESLITWRHGTDNKQPSRWIRVSVGLEDLEDLKTDFMQAFARLIHQQKL